MTAFVFKSFGALCALCFVAGPAGAQTKVREAYDKLAKAAVAAPKAARLVNLGELVTPADYPQEALDANESGNVTVVLTIDAAGKLKDCVVAASSGSPSLDVQTCRLFWTRAKFEPARGGDGKPATGTFRQTIRWLMQVNLLPRTAWSMRDTMRLQKAAPPTCERKSDGAFALDPGRNRDCADSATFRRLAGELAQAPPDLKPLIMVLEERFIPKHVPPAQIPALPGYVIVNRDIFHFGIAKGGQVSQCELIEGLPEEGDICARLGAAFEPASAAGAAAEGTIVRAFYQNIEAHNEPKR